ncbi:hypothetical protein GOP47_0001615 [Adiantum capillus-veneris]|uniref:Prephenate/arogenate dehydrogenase domain-containing protein n=1 Tax=Adiantum capillus-veneris TaxID=13818 RepID=A0A9D4V968_ADICA|nr:hypothetical protein GOP47_0001615 [Adiantum capillus-veneris]
MEVRNGACLEMGEDPIVQGVEFVVQLHASSVDTIQGPCTQVKLAVHYVEGFFVGNAHKSRQCIFDSHVRSSIATSKDICTSLLQFVSATEAVRQPKLSRRAKRKKQESSWLCGNHSLPWSLVCKQGLRKAKQFKDQKKLKIGLVGFGNYGQFLAETMVKQGHTVLAHSRSDYSAIGRKMRVHFFRDADDFCEEHPEVIVLCTSILSTEGVLQALPLQRLRRNTLFVDVLSVKEFPKNLLLQVLPTEFDVLCTHPMFGPQSGRGSWRNLPFVYDRVRIGKGTRDQRCEKFLDIFCSEGCRMVEMSCEEHDRHAASSQFITHTVGRVLCKLGLNSTPINTKGYETLLDLVENTGGDSFDLYYGLFMYNINATEELDRLELAFDSVKKQLFSQLHNVLRSQLFERVSTEEIIPAPIRTVENTAVVSTQLAKSKQTASILDVENYSESLNSTSHK